MPFANLEELQSSLKSHPQAQDILDYISSAVETEKQTGIVLKRKSDNEAKNLRKWKLKLEELGYEGDDVEAVGEWLSKQTKPATTDPNQSNPEIEKLKKEFQKAQKALEDERLSASKIKTTSDRRAIKAKLTEALRDKLVGHDLLVDNIINSGGVKLAEDESVVFVSGEEEIDFDKGIKKLLDSRPDLLKNTQAPGARSGSRPVSSTPRYTMDQIKTMTPEALAADMDNVKASMRAYKT